MLLVGTHRRLQDLDSGETLVDGVAVTTLAAGPEVWHALLDRRLVVRLDPNGPTHVGELPAADGQSMAVLSDGTVVVGRTGARLALVAPEFTGISSFEALPGREQWENPAAPLPDTRSMAMGSGRLWVNVHVGGLWSSGDRGSTWRAALQPDADVHEVRTGAEGLVAVAAAIGFGWSRDAGTSWSWTTKGLHAGYLRALALDDVSVVVSASDGPFTRRGAIYRTRLGGEFSRCEEGLPEWFPGNVDTGRLDATDGRVAIGFADKVYVSVDEGRSWRVAAKGLDTVTAVRLGRG